MTDNGQSGQGHHLSYNMQTLVSGGVQCTTRTVGQCGLENSTE